MPGFADGRQLRLQEGAVLQRAGRVLDPVHDPRLVLAPGGGPQRAEYMKLGCTSQKVNGVERRSPPTRRAARLPARRRDRPGARRRQQRAAARSRTAARTYLRARSEDLPRTPSPRGGTPRRSTATTRRSRTRVKRDPSDPARLLLVSCRRRARPRATARATCRCSRPRDPMNPEWAGQEADRVPGQLDDRHELLPQRLRPRAQPVRRRVPPPGRARRPTPTPGCAIPPRPTSVIRYRDVTPTSCSRSRGWSSPPRSPRSTRSSGRRSCSTTSRCSWA